jgi:uncharacterized protein YecE (DUF72 family)
MTHSDRYQPAAFEEFRRALEPLREAGMLGGVLAQFPHSFRPTAASGRYLEILRGELREVPVIVEFRNCGWVGETTLPLPTTRASRPTAVAATRISRLAARAPPATWLQTS